MLLRGSAWALALSSLSSGHVIPRQEDPAATSFVPPSDAPSSTPTVSTPTPDAPTPSTPPAVVGSGCEAVSNAFKAAAAEGGSAAVPPSVATACLASVPLALERDIGLIEFLLPYLSFQSTIGYLKKPPQGYLLPPIDVIGGAVAIREKLRKGGYKLQLEFVSDIYQLWNSVGDSHFTYSPALLGAFQFTRALNLTSVSSDGIELPKVFDINDVLAPGESVSEVASIDDLPIQDYLTKLGTVSGCQDPDAQFNSLFWSIPTGADISYSLSPILPDAHTVKFANGSSRVYSNTAAVVADFSTITTGEELQAAIEIPPPGSETSAAAAAKVRRQDAEPSDSPATPTATVSPGFPEPVAIHPNSYMAGYFLNSTDHEDTAVLSVTSFAPTVDAEGAGTKEFAATRKFVRDFFAACAKAGRTKLVIDVSSNGGGLAMQGYELYRNLFPGNKCWSGSRLRAHAALNILGENLYATNSSGKEVTHGLYLDPRTGKAYPNWKDFYGPVSAPEDKETSIAVDDFANKAYLQEEDGTSFFVTGFDPSDPAPPQPFAKENIIALTDGKCHSTCAIFMGLMQREAGVRTVALGGRPLAAPMQAVGGVKGSEVAPIKEIQSTWSTNIIAKGVTISKELLPGLPTDNLPPLMPVDLKDVKVNYRNAYPEDKMNDDKAPPRQFLYEAANCKRFYKGEYLSDLTALWRDVADVAWRGGLCVSGSTVNADGKIGDTTPEWSDKVMSKANIYDGPGSLTNADWLALSKNLTGSTEGLSNAAGRMRGGFQGVALGLVVAAVVAIVL